MVIEGGASTVVAEYAAEYKFVRKYQNEAELEAAFIKLLQDNGYEYLSIKNTNELLKNLRKQLSKLNNYNFSDNEWEQILKAYLANQNEGIKEKTRKILEDCTFVLKCDDGNIKNISIIDKKNIHNNFLQVINQYEVEGNYKNRYDVSVLVNGLPLAHIELKRRGDAIG
ncbi:hypothetical protein AGMMS49921_03940 [Endomicrobiia bacterium]|nr:hypothetical protein AGMMS49921_03940 [Endomicrobiia bacterium]